MEKDDDLLEIEVAEDKKPENEEYYNRFSAKDQIVD